jgi:hypothetical protein
MAERLQVDDWERLVAELERFDPPELTVEDDSVRLEFDVAHLAIFRDGRFTAGMPLHEVDGERAETVVVDHDAGAVTLLGASVEYTFRRPGG